jgi:hypothetical protein
MSNHITDYIIDCIVSLFNFLRFLADKIYKEPDEKIIERYKKVDIFKRVFDKDHKSVSQEDIDEMREKVLSYKFDI